MSAENEHLQSLRDIQQMMQKSSRFISLSGWSGVGAGLCALVGAWLAARILDSYGWASALTQSVGGRAYNPAQGEATMEKDLLLVAIATFAAAAAVAFFFTWLRSRKTGVPVWGFTARRVLINVLIPMLCGALVILRLRQEGAYGLIAPVSLLFYGLGLVNASKYTFPEIRYLGFVQLALGAFNLWLPGWGLYFWAAGFGLMHIVYGVAMWNKYERNPQ